MSDLFTLQGELVVRQAVRELGMPSSPELLQQLYNTTYLQDKTAGLYSLSSDSPVSVAFGSLASAHVVFIQATSKVRVRVTSADGTTQAIPTDLLLLISAGSPLTAIDLTRQPGITTQVQVLLGEKA